MVGSRWKWCGCILQPLEVVWLYFAAVGSVVAIVESR